MRRHETPQPGFLCVVLSGASRGAEAKSVEAFRIGIRGSLPSLSLLVSHPSLSGRASSATARVVRGEELMGVYNFQSRFVPKILAGEKTHTIRKVRVNPDKPGNVLHLYTGLRHKGAQLLMRVPCVKIEEIEIRAHVAAYDLSNGDVWTRFVVKIDGNELSPDECEALARRDGFPAFRDMMQFWDGRLPFRGHIIHWKGAA